MNLKQKAISGIKWTTLSTLIVAASQLLQISVLARYLDPSDFGLLAIITMVIGFSQMFVDFGISSAIIHKQNVTHKQLSTLYWLNILTAGFIYFIIVIIAPFIAKFYHEPKLSSLIILTSITIIIQSFGKQFFVLFEKKLQFNTLAKIDIAAALIGLITAIILATSGFGVYALIYPLILSMSIKSLSWIVTGLHYHRPEFYINLRDVKEFIVFGMYQTGSGIVSYFNSQFDIIIIGKVFGSETLGLYSIIKQLVMRPAQIINPIMTRVTFPTMATVQDNTQKLKEIYLRTINYLSSVNFPIYIVMVILAPEIVTIFLGAKWLNGVTLFQILSIFALYGKSL
jgi:O-antigen/teichoic acid export membrane protein